MKRLKTIFACMLMAVLSIGQVWADNAAVNDVLWGETFDHFYVASSSTQKTPSAAGTNTGTGGGTTIWGGASISYTQSSDNTKGYNEELAGGSSPELLLSKNNQTWTISGIKTGGATAMSLSFKSNKTTFGVTVSDNTNLEVSGSQKSWTISVKEGKTSPTTFNITIENTGSGNARIDNVVLKVTTAASSGGGETPSCTEPTTALSITNANTATIGTPLTLTSNGGNGGTITWSVAAGTGTASVSGNTLTPLTKGKVTVTATQDVNDGKCGATPTQEITISKAAPAPIAGTVVDELTSSTFASTGSYTTFTNKQAANEGHSAAVYAGKTSRNGNSTKYNVQLNAITSTGNPAGSAISTTTSGGLAKRVYVTWATQSTNTNNRKLTVYGKNDAAYTGTETATAGTEIGDIVYSTGDAFEYLDITDDYKFIQIVASGAIYMDQIDVYWLPIKSAITIDDDVENGSVGVSGIANLNEVAAGTEVTLTNDPASGYKLTAYDVYKTGASATKVTVSSGKFTMPDYGVTVSASFEATKTLSSISLSGEYPTVFLTGDAFSHTGMTVTANYDDNTHADVTADATFTGYNMSSASAQTVTVSYTEGTTKTQTYGITVKDAYTVTEILPMVPATGSLPTRVKGYISKIDSYDSNHNSITYWISDDGKTTSDQLEVYSGKNVGNTNFSSINDLEVGDFVTVSGNVKTFGQVKEFDYNNYIITGGRIQKGAVTGVVVSGTPSKTTPYTESENTFSPAGLVVTATYENGFSGVVTTGITWGDDLTDHKVTASGTVNVTATVGGETSDPYAVSVEFSEKTLSSIATDPNPASYTIYKGEALPKPSIIATYSEGDPADVTNDADTEFDTENVFDTDTPDDYTITVSYTFSGETKTTTYTVTVVDYANADDEPYTVSEALTIISAIGNTESADSIVVAGTVSEEKISNTYGRYKISDGTNELLVYNGKGFGGNNFTATNYPKVGDIVVVKGKVINFQGETPEFVSGKSILLSQVRPATLAITDITTGFEVGDDDLEVGDLTITTASDGVVTLASSNHEEFVTIVDGKLRAVAAGTATITANLAATTNENALNYSAATTTFSVTVTAAAVKYAITFDGNGATGGDAPEFDAEAAAGANITLPANTYTYTGKIFGGWKVINNSTTEEVEVTAGAFTMPASAVTIQAQWTDPSVWALTYTSNVNIGTDSVILSSVKYAAKKAGTGSAWGSTTVMVPMGTTKLHFHAVCYGADASAVTLNVKKGESVIGTFIINKDDGAKGNSPFTLDNTPYQQYYSVTLSNISAETTLTFEADQEAEVNGKRFIIFGVNQEGGILPVLDHITISGDLDTKSGYKTGDDLDLTGLSVAATYTLGSVEQTPVDITDDVVWSYDPLVADQTVVTITATYGDETDDIEITLDEAVVSGEPSISTDVNSRSWTVDKDAAIPESKKFAVTLKNITSATVTKGGDDPDAFTVTPSTLTASGDITVSVVSTATVGSYAATITIKDDDSETSKVVNVSLTVNEPETPEAAVNTESEWVVAQAADLVDGAEVLIVGVKKVDNVDYYYVAGEQGGNNRAAVLASVDGEGVLTPGENTMSFTLVDQLDETFALRTSNGKYLYAASSTKNYLRSQDEVDGNAKWTLTATSAEANGTNTNETLRFNTANTLFSCYADDSKETAIAFYVPKPAPKYSVTYAAGEGSGDAPDAVEYEENETFTVAEADLFTAPEGKEFDKWNDGTNDYEPGDTYTVGTADVVLTAQWKDAAPEPSYSEVRNGLTEGWYYTMCLDRAVTAVKAGSIWRVLSKAANGNDVILEEVIGTLDAGRPYIFLAAASTLEVAYTGDAVLAPVTEGNNGLVGSFTEELLAQNSNHYIIYNNALYYVNSDNVKVGEHRAYLDMTGVPAYDYLQGNAPGRRRVVMNVNNGNQMPTGIEGVEVSETPRKVMIAGQLFILRDKKMYDASGRLVK